MRDLVAWYIVELRRRLTSVDPQSRVEDFLLETRTHIGEAVDEMTSRGISEDDATKAAITDFGHPSLVASAFRGRRHMSPLTYWVLIAIVFLSAVPAIVQVVSSSTDNALGYWHVSSFDFGAASAVVFGAIALIAYYSRRWCSVPVIAASLVLVSAVGGWFVNRTNAYAMQEGSREFVMLSPTAAELQVESRLDWINEHDRVVPMLQSLIHAPKGADPEARLSLVVDETYGYAVPMDMGARSYSTYFAYAPELPGVASPRPQSGFVRWIGIEQTVAPRYTLVSQRDKIAALAAWEMYGDAYLEQLRAQRSLAEREAEKFKAPASVATGYVLGRLIWTPLAIVALYSLVALLANGLALIASDAAVSLRRMRWKRRFI